MMAGLRMPNPLDPETDQALDAAIRHPLIPWKDLGESDELAGWATGSFPAEGKTELPQRAVAATRGWNWDLARP